MTHRIEIDRTLCSGFGACVQAAPSAFALDADGVARPLVLLSDDPAVLEAAASCPMGAITVVAERAA
jgi:ferredoxin